MDHKDDREILMEWHLIQWPEVEWELNNTESLDMFII